MEIFSISGSGMAAERLRMDLIANNIANINTTRDQNGEPYRRKIAVFQEALNRAANKKTSFSGVSVAAITEDLSPLKLQYDPSHPDADENGYVHLPNVDMSKEMVDMITASRAYEANVSALQTALQMYEHALNTLG